MPNQEPVQYTHEQLLGLCDYLNGKYSEQGIPLCVMPLKTVLIMQETLKQAEAVDYAKLNQETVPRVGQNEQERGIIIGADWGIDIGVEAGGMPRPEHVHLARDTAQDIINSRNIKRR